MLLQVLEKKTNSGNTKLIHEFPSKQNVKAEWVVQRDYLVSVHLYVEQIHWTSVVKARHTLVCCQMVNNSCTVDICVFDLNVGFVGDKSSLVAMSDTLTLH